MFKRKWIVCFGETAITPYFHILESHIPDMIERSEFQSISHYNLTGNELKHLTQKSIQKRMGNGREESKKILDTELICLCLDKIDPMNPI